MSTEIRHDIALVPVRTKIRKEKVNGKFRKVRTRVYGAPIKTFSYGNCAEVSPDTGERLFREFCATHSGWEDWAFKFRHEYDNSEEGVEFAGWRPVPPLLIDTASFRL